MDTHYKIYLDSFYECGPFYVSKKTTCGRQPYQDPNGPATHSATTNYRKRKANNAKKVCIDRNDLLNDSELREDYKNFLKCLKYPSNEEGIATFRYNNGVSFKCERERRKEPIIEEQEEDSGADISVDDEDECEGDDGDENEGTVVEDDEDKDIDTDDYEDEEGDDDDDEDEDDNEDVDDDEDEADRCTENSSRISISPIEYSSFKARLQKETKRPFNQHEYDRLMGKAKKRNAIVKDRILRSGNISYQTNVVGKSYFDQFPDLKAKVLAANKSKALELLRGFFFWLQNLCHEGSYQPWVGRPRITSV